MEIEAAVPPVNLHLDYLQRRAAIRLNSLPYNSQVIRRLPPAWQAQSDPSTLQTTMQHHRPQASTQLTCLSRLTSAIYERIDIFAVEPWAHTIESFNGRLTVRPKHPKITKKEAAKQHIEYIQKLNTDNDRLIIYTDGSQLDVNRARQSGSAATFLRKG